MQVWIETSGGGVRVGEIAGAKPQGRELILRFDGDQPVEYMPHEVLPASVSDTYLAVRVTWRQLSVTSAFMTATSYARMTEYLASRNVPADAEFVKDPVLDGGRYTWKIVWLRDLAEYEQIFDHPDFQPYDEGEECPEMRDRMLREPFERLGRMNRAA